LRVMPDPRIVYCTTCRGRLQHLQETLPKNLRDSGDYPNAKFVILSYGDGEYLHEYTRDGRVVFYRFPTNDRFHVSHAKNLAARCGILEGADILVTLDADNSTGPGFSQFIANKFRDAKSGANIFLCPNFPHIQSLPYGPNRPLRGFAGRLAIRAQDFVKAGGYDETFDTWRGEDIDMIARLLRMGHKMHHIPIPFLNVIAHNADVRFKEYPEAQAMYENKQQVPIINARTETVVNFGKWGCGTVYRNFDPKPIQLGPMPTRIFGIGMHKTGTTSLDAAFKLLGFDSLHWGEGEAPQIWQEMNSSGRSKIVEQYYALSDLPIPLLYEKLDKAYTGSKFILTVRDEAKWIKSVERLWDARYNPTRWVWDKYPFTNNIHTVLYGQKDFSAEIFLARYRRHNAEVIRYFAGRQDLLVMNMDEHHKWPWLCQFLNVPTPDVPYPIGNQTKNLLSPEESEAVDFEAAKKAPRDNFIRHVKALEKQSDADQDDDGAWLKTWGWNAQY
jgi:hypothetical protein